MGSSDQTKASTIRAGVLAGAFLIFITSCGGAEGSPKEGASTTPFSSTTPRTTLASAGSAFVNEPIEGTVVVNHGDYDAAGEIRNAKGAMPKDPDEALYAASVFSGDGSLVEIRAPDGHHLTLQEWLAASGKATIQCVGDGARYEFEFRGLIPNGVYTIWQHLMSEQVAPDERVAPVGTARPVASGSLAGDGRFDEATVIASDTGTATIKVDSPSGPMSMIGERGGCPLRDHPTVFLILNYHIDGETYGPTPGPDDLDAGHVHILFQQADIRNP